MNVEPDHEAVAPAMGQHCGCSGTGIQVLFPARVEPGKVFALLWVVQKGFLDRAEFVGVCKMEMLLQNRCLMPGSSFPIVRETPGDEKAPGTHPPQRGTCWPGDWSAWRVSTI